MKKLLMLLIAFALVGCNHVATDDAAMEEETPVVEVEETVVVEEVEEAMEEMAEEAEEAMEEAAEAVAE